MIRDRPAAFPVNVTAIDDTKNFDEFPEVELNFSKFSKISNPKLLRFLRMVLRGLSSGKPSKGGEEAGYKDWMFMNYTFKRCLTLTLLRKVSPFYTPST